MGAQRRRNPSSQVSSPPPEMCCTLAIGRKDRGSSGYVDTLARFGLIVHTSPMSTPSPALVPELSVVNLAHSVDFYTRILGFTIAYQRIEEGFAYLIRGEVHLMLDAIDIGRTWKTAELTYPFGRGVNLQIEVESLAPLLLQLQSAHTLLFLEVEERWYRKDAREVGQKQIVVQDPDGYLLRFFEPLGERPLL